MADKKNGIYCNCDTNVSASSIGARPQEFGIPGTPEGPTCGLLEFTELYEYATVIHVPTPAESGVSILLGDDIASDGSSLWDGGAVALMPADSISVALSELNKYLVNHSSGSLADLTDVDFATAAPAPGDVLTYEDGAWQAKTPQPSGAESLSELTDVDFATAAPAPGDILTYEDGAWQAKTPEAADSEHILLGVNTGDGDWADGAVPLDPSKTVGYAIDNLNSILGLLVPAQPPAFPNGTALTVSNAAGNSPRLATGVTDNSHDSTLLAGDAVVRLAAATLTTNTFNDVGPGTTGTIEFILDNSIVGQHVLTGSGDNGNYSGLIIADQKDYPLATPGFWKSIDVSAAGINVPDGINSIIIQHSAAGYAGYTYFVKDNLNAVPTISAASVTENAAGTYAYSSSIPHYGTGGKLNVSASYSNLAGETYYGGSDPFIISGTNSIIASKTRTYADLSIPTPIDRQTTAATAIATQVIDVDGTNVHNSGLIQGVAKNVAGNSTTTTLSPMTILVKRGTTSRIDENSVTVSGLGSSPNSNPAVRVGMDSGDKPALSSKAAWNSASALATHEATVVGGAAKHDQTNYSANFFPNGPDLSSGRSGAQYITFSFQRSALSAFKIAITGSYAGCWIALPGVSDAQPNGDGWWDMFQSYDGSGIPGETGDTNAGCALGTAMSGSSGTFQATFGSASSTNSTSNEILVRIKLNSGQLFTALSFTN